LRLTSSVNTQDLLSKFSTYHGTSKEVVESNLCKKMLQIFLWLWFFGMALASSLEKPQM
jgi:hypothetical protein